MKLMLSESVGTLSLALKDLDPDIVIEIQEECTLMKPIDYPKPEKREKPKRTHPTSWRK